jgi:hypothetical protein
MEGPIVYHLNVCRACDNKGLAKYMPAMSTNNSFTSESFRPFVCVRCDQQYNSDAQLDVYMKLLQEKTKQNLSNEDFVLVCHKVINVQNELVRRRAAKAQNTDNNQIQLHKDHPAVKKIGCAPGNS